MCMVFMSGLPYAGKSLIVNEIIKKLPPSLHVVVLDPKTYRCDNYDQLNEEQKKDENISIWEATLDVLGEEIKKLSNKSVLIYDTACATRTRMEPYFRDAKKSGHKVLYIFVQASEGKCDERAVDKKLPEEVINRYLDNFSKNVAVFKKLSDRMIIIITII